MKIELLCEPECGEFFTYLNDHRSENGNGEIGYFIPRPRSESCLLLDKQNSFRAGLNVPVGAPGWRRAWIARASNRQVVGHVDLWSHPVSFAEHRCLLGVGVQRAHRRLGLGTALLSHATQWALANTRLEWLDLQVLSTNEPAMQLYLRAGFMKVGEVPEMFKFDGHLLSETKMTKRIRENHTR